MRRVLAVLLALSVLNAIYIEVSLAAGNMPFFVSFALSTLLVFAVAVLHAGRRLGWKRMLILLALTFGVSLLFESVGVMTGLVYGPYHYTEQLGTKFLGLVPLFVPLGWFLMSYPSFVIADWIIPSSLTFGKRVLGIAALGGLIMTSWDLVVDPVRVQSGQWVWEARGQYFGVPLQNYLGWWLTTFVTFILFLSITRYTSSESRNASFDNLALISYALTGFTEISAALVIGLGGPALAGFFAMIPWVIMGWARMRENG